VSSTEVTTFWNAQSSSAVHHLPSRPASRESATRIGTATCTPPGENVPVCCFVIGPCQTPSPPSTHVWFSSQVLLS